MCRLVSIMITVQALAPPAIQSVAPPVARVEIAAPACSLCERALGTLARGAPIALTLRDGRELHGAFVRLRADTLVLHRAPAFRRPGLLEERLAEIHSLHLGERRSRHATVVGCVIGAIAGGLIGLHVGLEEANDEPGWESRSMFLQLDNWNLVLGPIASTVGGALLGAGAGGLVGLIIDASAGDSFRGAEILCE